MTANGALYRLFRAPRSGIHKVQLGPGRKNYLEGWINVDANMFMGKCDVWTDFSYRLLFHNNSIDAIYSHHVVEHLPNLDRHFAEVFRCLKIGGTYRVAGPNGDNGIRKFLEDDTGWFSNWPDNRKSIGGRLNNFLLCRKRAWLIARTAHSRPRSEPIVCENQ